MPGIDIYVCGFLHASKGRNVMLQQDAFYFILITRQFVIFQKVLAAHGAAKISAYVTHGIFPNKSWARFGHDNGGSVCFTLLIKPCSLLLLCYKGK